MKRSPSFPKEYDLKFGYGTSTIFNAHDIDFITFDSYDTSDESCTSPYSTRWLAIDPGWDGSKSFGIVIVQWKDSKLELVYEEELQVPLGEEVRKLIYGISITECYRLFSISGLRSLFNSPRIWFIRWIVSYTGAIELLLLFCLIPDLFL